MHTLTKFQASWILPFEIFNFESHVTIPAGVLSVWTINKPLRRISPTNRRLIETPTKKHSSEMAWVQFVLGCSFFWYVRRNVSGRLRTPIEGFFQTKVAQSPSLVLPVLMHGGMFTSGRFARERTISDCYRSEFPSPRVLGGTSSNLRNLWTTTSS